MAPAPPSSSPTRRGGSSGRLTGRLQLGDIAVDTAGPGRRCPAGYARPPCPRPSPRPGLSPRLPQHRLSQPEDEPALATTATATTNLGGPRRSLSGAPVT